jgi:hypothetical protein
MHLTVLDQFPSRRERNRNSIEAFVMVGRPIPTSNLDLVDWFARGMLAIAAVLLIAAILACAYLAIQITTPAAASASAMTSSISPVSGPETMTCGQKSFQALSRFSTSMSIFVVPFAAIGGLFVVGTIFAMMTVARD